MNRLFKPKTIRRMSVFLLLIAPLVYLFGSLFFALNGANGESVLADGETSYTDMHVEHDGVSYNRVLYFPDDDVGLSCSYVDMSYSVFIGSDRYYTTSASVTSSYLPLADSLDFRYYLRLDVTSGAIVYNSFLRDNECCAFSLDGYWLIEIFGKKVYYVAQDLSSNSFAVASVSISYRRNPCSFSNLLGQFASLNDLRLIPLVQPIINIPASVNESDYVFGQFFAKGNFLSKIGDNAISDNPIGFSPFGYFFSYIDSNMLHLADSQIGLMAYGYMYWCAHVLLFDVAFMLVTFFLSWMQHIGDKFTGGD